MSIASKLTQIAENEIKVYKAGQKSVIDESKIIEKTVSGSVITVDDVSEVPHEVGVQLASGSVTDFSGVGVKVYGENFWKFASSFSAIGNGTTQAFVDSYNFDLPLGLYTFGCDIEVTNLNMSSNGNAVYLGVTQADGTVNYYTIIRNGSTSGKVTFVVGVSASPITRFSLTMHNRVTSGTIKITNIYLTASEHESYMPKADGSVAIKSISPYMTITTDTTDVNITATYHKSFGMQTEYDRFWDALQNKGKLTNYSFTFGGESVNDAWYNPKYPIIATSNTNMFRNCAITDTKVDIDVRGSNGTYVFNNAEKLVIVRKLIVDEVTVFTGWFAYCKALEEIRFEGIIGKSLDIHWSTKLSAASYYDIITHLSPTIAGCILTVPNNARVAYDATNGEGSWDMTLQMFCPSNWTIAYA